MAFFEDILNYSFDAFENSHLICCRHENIFAFQLLRVSSRRDSLDCVVCILPVLIRKHKYWSELNLQKNKKKNAIREIHAKMSILI